MKRRKGKGRKRFDPYTVKEKEDPLNFFLSCIPELRKKPYIQEYIAENPHCKQSIMVPTGNGRFRSKGPIRKMLRSNELRKWIFERGMAKYILLLDKEFGKIPSSSEIAADCRKYGAINIVRLIYSCNLFGGSIDNLYEKSGLAIKI